jgi:hypothetical protein
MQIAALPKVRGLKSKAGCDILRQLLIFQTGG